MNVYIWENTGPVSTAYHDGGGLLIVAATLEDARSAWLESEAAAGLANPEAAIQGAPDWKLKDTTSAPMILTFPDVGCC